MRSRARNRERSIYPNASHHVLETTPGGHIGCDSLRRLDAPLGMALAPTTWHFGADHDALVGRVSKQLDPR